MITYLIQLVFRSDFYLTEIQARIESVYRLVSSYCQKILYIMSVFSLESDNKKIRSESHRTCVHVWCDLMGGAAWAHVIGGTRHWMHMEPLLTFASEAWAEGYSSHSVCLCVCVSPPLLENGR